jgi:osmotically inducible protein OsmC
VERQADRGPVGRAHVLTGLADAEVNSGLDSIERELEQMSVLNCKFKGRAAAHGGRTGTVSLGESGHTVLELKMPAALGGMAAEHDTNPEELMGAAVAAAFYGSILHMARDRQLQGWDHGAAVAAEVGILFPDDRSYYRLEVVIHVNLPAIDPGLARQLLREAQAGNGYWELLERSGVRLVLMLDGELFPSETRNDLLTEGRSL